MTCLPVAWGRSLGIAALFSGLSVASLAGAQPAPEPQPSPPPTATAVPLPPPDGSATIATSPDSMPTSQLPLTAAPPEPPAVPPPIQSPARDRMGNALDGRPFRLAWQPGEVIPPGYEPWSSPSKRFLISGMVVGGAPYLGSFIGAYVAAIKGDVDAWGSLFAPVVGPFIAIETAEASGFGAYMLFLDGLAQTAGIALTIVAVTTRDHGLKRQKSGTPPKFSAPAFSAGIRPGGASLTVEF